MQGLTGPQGLGETSVPLFPPSDSDLQGGKALGGAGLSQPRSNCQQSVTSLDT